MAEISEQTRTKVATSIRVTTANNIFRKRKVINDPIHGQIELHPVCCRIMDTPQIQRLRHIKQLDTCYLVYPGASHNRFEHSLGVCYLASKLLKAIRERQPDEDISEKDILCVEIAGLCHDMGQGPFSHVFEKRFMPKMKKPFTHENTARKMFEFMLQTENGKLKEDIREILKDCGIQDFNDRDFTFISEMIDDPKGLEDPVWPYAGRGEDKSYMYEIVANKRNGVDVDKWDYIARDSYMLGMKVNVDYNRCFMSARVIKCNGVRNNTSIPVRKQICYREKEAQDLYDMFYTRMTLHRRAYQHKTHKIIGIMICDALISAEYQFLFRGKRISETVDDMEAYTYLTDEVIQLILNDGNRNLKEAQEIIKDIMYRRLYRCVKQVRCKSTTITEEEVKAGIGKHLDRTAMPDNFFHCDIVDFNYGMENNNPMEKVRFYKRDNLDKALRIDKEQVSFVLPDTFEESVIRIYCKVQNDHQSQIVEKITTAFDRWWEKKLKQEETEHQTELKRLHEPSEPDSQIIEPENSVLELKELKETPLSEPATHGSTEDPPSLSGENIAIRPEY